MFSVRAIEKNAIAAVISSRGSAKRRIRPIIPGRCHAGIGIGTTLPAVASLYSDVCPGPVCARILSSRPSGTSGSGLKKLQPLPPLPGFLKQGGA